MMDLTLPYSLQFSDLYDRAGLERVDHHFLDSLPEDLQNRLLSARVVENEDESQLIIELAPYLEDFLSHLFGIQAEIHKIREYANAYSAIATCKRQFIQRIVSRAYTDEEVKGFHIEGLYQTLEDLISPQFSDLQFAKAVLAWMEVGASDALEIAKQYAAHKLRESNSEELFSLPKKKDYSRLLHVKQFLRDGFDCTTPPVKESYALDQAHYCIKCHHQGKDSCSQGLMKAGEIQKNPLGVELNGCPLEEKISEMNELREQGYAIGALATVVIDNPMVAGTGHRICNDCMAACIYQKQDPVDVPSIESETLQRVLDLPWGFEIYSLLTRWNPLNFKSPLPKSESGYKVLVAGMGPAGYTLSHYLLQEGHKVEGIDGLKIEPLPEDLSQFRPIYKISDYLIPLSQRKSRGFGGVAEYGITARWDKNNLLLIRLLLERRSQFSLHGGIRLGGTITFEQAFEEYGFDHIALCMGAGKPKLLNLPGGLPRGVRMASDFLMSLQLTGADRMDSLTNLELRLPIVVIGGGLTAMDTTTEALAYYPLQVERFLRRYEILGPQENWTDEERTLAETFINHSKAIRQEREKAKEAGRSPQILKLLQGWGGCTLIYRKSIQESPAYRLNHEEVNAALAQGVRIVETAKPHDFIVDEFGHLSHVEVERHGKFEKIPAGSALLALGTQPNTQIAEEEGLALTGQNFAAEDSLFIRKTVGRSISYLGDLNPHYSGSVVKAMASAKSAYQEITQVLVKATPKSRETEAVFDTHVVEVKRLTPNIVEIIVKAPMVARNFKPGQFFRLQNYEALAEVKRGTPLVMEGLALTGADADPKAETVSLIVLEMGGSSDLCGLLKPNEPVILMGPTGSPTEIYENKNILLVGGGLGNAVLFSIGKALKAKGSKVLYVAGYKHDHDRFKVDEIEAASDQVIWCCDEKPSRTSNRPQDQVFHGNVVQALENYGKTSGLGHINHMIVIGSDRMMAAVARARVGALKPYLNPNHTAIGSINSPMQCMMKAICAQCLQAHKDPETGEVSYVFSCVNQDQPLSHVDFEMLNSRLKANSMSEKQTHAWVRGCLVRAYSN